MKDITKSIAGWIAPSLDDIADLAADALTAIPAELLAHTKNIVISVEDLCGPDIEQDMELDSPLDLLGLYQGRPLDQRSILDVADDVDRITLYRQALLFYWMDRDDPLGAIVRNVIIHEIGHHFGLSDDDMEQLEADGAST